jgi:peptidoglycan/xylan/chitin deacetylase (PgdA/CDA1 family)
MKQMNVLSVDLESWVHKYFLDCESSIKKTKDDSYICNAALDTLKILETHDVKTTFFIVAEIFDWYPKLINKIREMGHEIGFHTSSHRMLLNKKYLLDELRKGKKFIDEFDIKGFRAPEAFIKKDYLTILKDWGFSYDSSVYAEFEIFEPVEGILELPISTYPLYNTSKPIEFPRKLTPSLMIKEIPFGSGYFIGLLGSNIQWFIKRSNKKNIPASLVIHPWQIMEHPTVNGKIKGSLLNRIKMIPYNINRRETFNFLCQNFEIIPMIKFINNYDLTKKPRS